MTKITNSTELINWVNGQKECEEYKKGNRTKKNDNLTYAQYSLLSAQKKIDKLLYPIELYKE